MHDLPPTRSIDSSRPPTKSADPNSVLCGVSRPRSVLRETATTYESPVAGVAVSNGASAPDAGPADLGFPEAGTVHELLKALHGIGNKVRLRYLDALRTLHDGKLCYELGYCSFYQYCDRELGLARSTSHEYVRVARALDHLPRLRVLFGQGELSWEQVRSISRVATADTEVAWIECAFAEPVKSLLAEAREALRTGRDTPRDKRHGLPNLMVRLYLDLTFEEKQRVRAAFELVTATSGYDLGGGPGDSVGRDVAGDADPRPPLVRWADGVLSGAIPAGPVAPERRNGSGLGNGAGLENGAGPENSAGPANGSGAKRLAPAQTILYRTCPQCRETTLDTDDGAVSIAPERAAELAPVSNRVEIAAEDEVECDVMPPGEVDEPNSQRLARQVISRDGLRCANPGCDRRRNLHAHHIVFRAHGGRTVLSNEVAVCDTCHAMLHMGLLEVTGSPDTGLTWRPRPVAAGAKVRDAAALHDMLQALDADLEASGVSVGSQGRPPVAETMQRQYSPSERELYGLPGGFKESSTTIDTLRLVEDLAEGLVRLGCGRRESKRRVRAAIATLMETQRAELGQTVTPEQLDEAAILTEALRQ